MCSVISSHRDSVPSTGRKVVRTEGLPTGPLTGLEGVGGPFSSLDENLRHLPHVPAIPLLRQSYGGASPTGPRRLAGPCMDYWGREQKAQHSGSWLSTSKAKGPKRAG